MKYLCKVWKCRLPVFYPFQANLRAAETTVSRRMCAGFNLQLSTLNPVSLCIHSARWSIEIFMRLSPARHFFPSVFRLLPRRHTFCPYLGVLEFRSTAQSASNDGEKRPRILRTTRFRYVDTLPSAGMDRWKHITVRLSLEIEAEEKLLCHNKLRNFNCSSVLHLSDSTGPAAHSVWNSVCARLGVKHLRGR